MVDIDPEKTEQLRFVVAPSPTLASSTLVQVREPERKTLQRLQEGARENSTNVKT